MGIEDISGIGPKTAEKFRNAGFGSKESLLSGFKEGNEEILDSSSRVLSGIREELTDRGERFEDPSTGITVGPENRNAFETFSTTTVGDMNSIDTRASPASAGDSIAEFAPQAASGELGQRGYGGSALADFASDAAANLGLTEMSGAEVQEMNRRGTNPTAARLGTPREEDPYGVSIRAEPPVDRTNPERLEPNEPAVRTDGPAGERRVFDMSDRESAAAQRTVKVTSPAAPVGPNAIEKEEAYRIVDEITEAEDEDRPAELTPEQERALREAAKARSDDERDFNRFNEDFSGLRQLLSDSNSDRVSSAVAPDFAAEPAAQLLTGDTTRRKAGDEPRDDAAEERSEDVPLSVELREMPGAEEMQDSSPSSEALAGTGLAPSDFTSRYDEFDEDDPIPDETPEEIIENFSGETDDEDGETVAIGPRGSAEIDASAGGFTVVDSGGGSTRLSDDQGREVTISRRETGQHGRRKSFGVSMQKEEGRSLGNPTVSERVRFGSYASQGVSEATSEVESLLETFGSSRFGMRAEEQRAQFDALPAVTLLDSSTEGEETDLIRLKSSGTFAEDPVVQAPESPGLRSANGRYVGDPENISRPADPNAEIKRKENGEFFIP